jgi:hypothetical protein
LHVGPVEGARKHAKARGDEYDQNGLHRHRSNSIRLIDAIMLDWVVHLPTGRGRLARGSSGVNIQVPAAGILQANEIG